VKELVAEGILPNETDAAFAAMSGPARDEVWTRAACYIIQKRKPHLLALHLLNTDGIHHRYGPGSSASYTALALADSYLGRVLATIETAGIRANTTVILLADHGFATATNILQPNVLLRQARLLTVGASNQVTKARVQVVPEGGSGMVYLNNPETREEDRKKVIALFAGKEGIAEVVEPERFGAIGMPSPENHRGMADLILAAKIGYGIAGTATGDDFVVHAGIQSNVGYHGYLASNPAMDVPLVVAGPGIKSATKIGVVENIDVAPTIARILGVKLHGAQGKALVFE
jgi:predicted AlkP superfamily pyrophosphatase or phosphodiesterase